MAGLPDRQSATPALRLGDAVTSTGHRCRVNRLVWNIPWPPPARRRSPSPGPEYALRYSRYTKRWRFHGKRPRRPPNHLEPADAYAARVPPHPPLAGYLRGVGGHALGRLRARAGTSGTRRGRSGVLRGTHRHGGERHHRRRAVPAPRARPRDARRCARRRPLLPAPARSGGGTRPPSRPGSHTPRIRPQAHRSLPHGAIRDGGIRRARGSDAATRTPGDAQPRDSARRLPAGAALGFARHRDRGTRRRALLDCIALGARRACAHGERGARSLRRRGGGAACERKRPALPPVRMVRRARPRPRSRLERGRVRPRLHCPPLPEPGGRIRHCARRRAVRDSPAGVRIGHLRRAHSGACGTRRHRHAAYRVLVVRILRAGARGPGDARPGQAHRAHR